MGLFRIFIVMRMKAVRSLREMTRLLDNDPRLRKLYLIKKDEKGYTRSVFSRFIRKVGEDNLNKIIDEKVIKLLKSNAARNVDTVLDASFIKAWSTRHPESLSLRPHSRRFVPSLKHRRRSTVLSKATVLAV